MPLIPWRARTQSCDSGVQEGDDDRPSPEGNLARRPSFTDSFSRSSKSDSMNQRRRSRNTEVSPGSRNTVTGSHARGIMSYLSSKSKLTSSRTMNRIKGFNNEMKGAAKFTYGMGDTVTSVVISEDMEVISASSTNKKAVVMNVSDGAVIGEFTADSGINTSVIAGSGASARLIVGTFSGWIRVYHIASNREEHAVKFGDGDAINAMALAAYCTRLAVGGKSAHILLYALCFSEQDVGMNVLYSFKTDGSTTLSISLDTTAEKLVAGGESKVVQMWVIPKPGGATAMTGLAGSLGAQKQNGSENQGSAPQVQFRTASTVHSLALSASGKLAVPFPRPVHAPHSAMHPRMCPRG